jgi:PKD repeat protein
VFNNPTSGGCAPYTTGAWNNLSSGCTNYLWDFGDGSTSTAVNPTHFYADGGNYTVTLQGWNSGSYVGEYSRPYYVEGFPSTFTTNPVCPGAEFELDHGMYWSSTSDWDMGDGSTYSYSGDTRVWHKYATPGVYSISLDLNFPSCGPYSGTIPIVVSTNAEILDAYMHAWDDSICSGDEITFDLNWAYHYIIDFGDGEIFQTSGSLPNYGGNTHTYSGLGTYYPSVTYVNACGNDTTVHDTVYVVNSDLSIPSVQLNIDDDTLCLDEEVRIYTYSNASDITYDWGDGTGELTPDYFEFISYSATGDYSVTVTVVSGCGVSNTETDVVTVVETKPITYANIGVPDSVCVGSGAFMDASVSGDENYMWDLGDGTTAITETVSHIYASAGTYIVSVTASNGCGSDSVMVDTIVASTSYGFGSASFALGYPEEGCPGDTAMILFIPGNGNTYEVNYGGGFVPETASLFDPGYGFVYDVIKHRYATPGVYNAVLRTTNPCGAVRLDTVTFDWTGTSQISADFLYDLNQEICIGQPLAFYPIGGNFNTWDFGDGSGIVTSFGMLNEVEHVYHLPGSYDVILTVTDLCGNMDIDTQNVVIPDTRIMVTANAVNSTCGMNDGMAIVSVAGGTTPYSFQWTSGDTTIIADSLTSGIYQVNVVDAIGCVNFDIATVSDVEAPTIAVTTLIDVSCSGGSDGAIDINVIGGNAPFTYEWSNGKTTQDINGLAAGPYEVFVTDATGCVATASISVGEPSGSIVSFSKKNSNCGFNDGSATVFVSGSNGPYTFVWGNGSGSETINGLPSESTLLM